MCEGICGHQLDLEYLRRIGFNIEEVPGGRVWTFHKREPLEGSLPAPSVQTEKVVEEGKKEGP